MTSIINTNVLSLVTQNNLNKSQAQLNTAIERLSSGSKINSAKDDAAGQAIANRFTANITGLSKAAQNANDGISLAQTTEGALNEVNNNLQRIRELTVQATNGTNSSSDLASIQAEITQRLSEIDRNAAQTDFNGTKVLSSTQSMKIQIGANDGESISINLKAINSSTLGLSGFSVSSNALPVSKEITTVGAGTATAFKADLSAAVTSLNAAGGNVKAADLSLHEITGAGGAGTGKFVVQNGSDFYAASVDSSSGNVTLNTVSVTVADAVNGNTTGSAVTGQLVKVSNNASGAATGYVTLQGKNYNLAGTALTNLDTTAQADDDQSTTTIQLSKNGATAATAQFAGSATTDPLTKLDAALKQVDDLRSDLGAVQNRFASTITNLGTAVTNLSASRSRIEDADYATEVSNMTKAQILQQAGNSVLAQANKTSQSVMSLLQ